MRITDTSDLWWKNAVVYCLDVKRFADSDGDGWGDFRGLAGKVDYLADLGVTCLWLMPFYPSPMRDDGYDITDYYGIDPRLGTFGDFVEFMRTAHDRGMRVITDLVPNHTSDEHPWFQSARQGRDSPFHDWYVWADEKPAESPTDVAFPGEETSIWEYAPECDRYFLHRFYRFQPDLDVSNPEVREEIARIAGFWLELGVSGFRIDAVPALLETDDDAARARLPDPHDFLRDLRALPRPAGRRLGAARRGQPAARPAAPVLRRGPRDRAVGVLRLHHHAEPLAVDGPPGRQPGGARRAVAARPGHRRRSGAPSSATTTSSPSTGSRSASARRSSTPSAPKKSMQVYNRGLRRRAPTMLDGDHDRIRLLYSLMFSLPGTPVLFYGEEIGMGENLAADQRLAVRTPMQWTGGPQRRLLRRPAADLVSPVVRGAFAPPVGQRRRSSAHDPDSMHAFVRSLVRAYRECPELGWGAFTLLDCDPPGVLAHRCTWQDRARGRPAQPDRPPGVGHRDPARGRRPGPAGRAAGRRTAGDGPARPPRRPARALRPPLAAGLPLTAHSV